MNNIQLLKAVALSLESALLTVHNVIRDEQAEQASDTADRLGEVLGKIFGAGNGANTLNTGDNTGEAEPNKGEKPEDPVIPTAVVVPAPATTSETARAPIEIINDMLNDERYTLRSFTSIYDKTGLDKAQVLEALDDNDVDYVVLNKRNSDEQVVGLSERN